MSPTPNATPTPRYCTIHIDSYIRSMLQLTQDDQSTPQNTLVSQYLTLLFQFTPTHTPPITTRIPRIYITFTTNTDSHTGGESDEFSPSTSDIVVHWICREQTSSSEMLDSFGTINSLCEFSLAQLAPSVGIDTKSLCWQFLLKNKIDGGYQ